MGARNRDMYFTGRLLGNVLHGASKSSSRCAQHVAWIEVAIRDTPSGKKAVYPNTRLRFIALVLSPHVSADG